MILTYISQNTFCSAVFQQQITTNVFSFFQPLGLSFLKGEVFLQTAHRGFSLTQTKGRTGGAGPIKNPDSSSSIISLNPPTPSTNPDHCLFIQSPQALTGNIPHSHSLVQTGRHHQIFRWVELRTHHIVIMTGKHTVDNKERKKN